MSMERLTHEADFGLEDWEETLFFVKSDPNGAYNILDIAKYHGENEFDEILKNIAIRLSEIENILGDTYDLNRLRELVEADKDGRIKIIPGYIDKACGTCAHFLRIEGTRRGKCAVKPLACSRYTTWNTPFEPSQSRKACKQYIAAEAALAKEADHE